MTNIFDNSYPIDVSFEDPKTGQKFTTQADVEVSFKPDVVDSEMFHVRVDFAGLLHGIENVRLASQLTTGAVLLNYADAIGDLDDPLQ